MPDLRPYLVLGLALGGVFAVSGVGMVVLYRATGVLNLAYGAIGALGSLIAWSMINGFLLPDWLSYVEAVVFGGVASLVYGVLFGLYHWVESYRLNVPARTGTVMLAVLPVILGFQLLLQALVLDVQSGPRGPLQARLRKPILSPPGPPPDPAPRDP